MEETVNGPMLVAKRADFQKAFNGLEDERLPSEDWIASFCKAYKIKVFRRHGEAASVDLLAVEQEQARVAAILQQYKPQDCFNFDETGLFAFAPPDHGQSLSGKKKDKFHITLGFASNADGSEKLSICQIGKPPDVLRVNSHQSGDLITITIRRPG